MSVGPWTLVIKREADGAVSHVLTTPRESVAYREALRIMGELKALGAAPGSYTALIVDTDSANEVPVELPASSRSIIVPTDI